MTRIQTALRDSLLLDFSEIKYISSLGTGEFGDVFYGDYRFALPKPLRLDFSSLFALHMIESLHLIRFFSLICTVGYLVS